MQKREYGPIVYTHEEIVKACKRLAAQISEKFKDAKLVTLVGILKGAVPFMAELIKHLTIEVRIDFMIATSYKDNRQSGELKMVMDLSHSVKGHDVIVVEDICDSGLTLSQVTKHIKGKSPNSVSTVVLLSKPQVGKVNHKPDFYGFLHKGPFIAGFGFDDDGYLRNLPFIVEVPKK